MLARDWLTDRPHDPDQRLLGSSFIGSRDPLLGHFHVLNEKKIAAIEPIPLAIFRQPLDELGELPLDRYRARNSFARGVSQPISDNVDRAIGRTAVAPDILT